MSGGNRVKFCCNAFAAFTLREAGSKQFRREMHSAHPGTAGGREAALAEARNKDSQLLQQAQGVTGSEQRGQQKC